MICRKNKKKDQSGVTVKNDRQALKILGLLENKSENNGRDKEVLLTLFMLIILCKKYLDKGSKCYKFF